MSETHDALTKPVRPWGGWAFCLLLGAFGFGCHGIIMVTNFVQGWSAGHGGTSNIVYACLAGAVDFGGVGLCSILSSRMLRQGNRVGSVSLMGVVVVSAIVSLVMFYGYNASNRVEPTKLAARQYSAELTAATQAAALENAARARTQAFLEEQAAKAADAARKKAGEGKTTAAEQLKFYTEEMKKAAKIEVKAGPVQVESDAMASQLSARSGLKVDVVQDLIGTVLSCMGMVLGSVMLFFSNYLWPDRKTIAEIRADNEAERQVIEWERAGTIRMPGARHRSTEVYKHYKRYAVHRGWDVPHPIKFASTIAALYASNRTKLRRVAEGSYVLYEDRMLDYRPAWANVPEPVTACALRSRAQRRTARRQPVIMPPQVEAARATLAETRPTLN